MIQELGKQKVNCPFCKIEHDLLLVAFNKSFYVNNLKGNHAEFYHYCSTSDCFYQTDMDSTQTFIQKRIIKKKLENI